MDVVLGLRYRGRGNIDAADWMSYVPFFELMLPRTMSMILIHASASSNRERYAMGTLFNLLSEFVAIEKSCTALEDIPEPCLKPRRRF